MPDRIGKLSVMTDGAVEVPLGDAAYVRLRDDIIACRLPPGHRLTERRLSASTGFGVSPIREALTRLDHDGLVVTLPRKGYQVAPLTMRVVDELFDIWEFIGPEVARRGLERGNTEQLQDVVAAFAALQNALARWGSDDQTGSALDLVLQATAIYQSLAAVAGNAYLANMLDKLVLELSRVYVLILNADATYPARVLATNADMSATFQSGDVAAVEQETRRFIRESHNEVLHILARWPSVMATEVTPI